jgi:hypothetical protein
MLVQVNDNLEFKKFKIKIELQKRFKIKSSWICQPFNSLNFQVPVRLRRFYPC